MEIMRSRAYTALLSLKTYESKMAVDLGALQNSPLFEALLPSFRAFTARATLPSVDELNAVLDIPHLRFVAQSPRTNNFHDGYEPRIFLRNEVQTRANSYHDFFNALVWHRFLKTKRAINSLHYQAQISHYPSKHRTPVENMLTLFDENGGIVVALDPYLLDLIRNHEWHELFWQRREYTRQNLKVIIFGHGLYEKALSPYIGITAQCLLFAAKNLGDSLVDDVVARFLSDKNTSLSTKDLHPVPLLGVPGWWADNEDENFYHNKNYFRSI